MNGQSGRPLPQKSNSIRYLVTGVSLVRDECGFPLKYLAFFSSWR